jgi:predicted O-methyltransferase YrrM
LKVAPPLSSNVTTDRPIPFRVARIARRVAFEMIRRYHDVLPAFVELYAGGPGKLGPIFAKDADFLFSLTRLLMPQTIVEIGVGLAASDIAFAHALRKNARGRLIAIDLSRYSIDRSRRLLGYHGLADLVTFIEGHSHLPETYDRVAATVGQADLLFIDGDHSYEGALADFDTYHRLVAEGGVIVFHDTGAFPAQESALLADIVRVTPDEKILPTEDGRGIYHRPGVPQAIDKIVQDHPEYSLLSLHTYAEPSCGMVMLQKRANLFRPKRLA